MEPRELVDELNRFISPHDIASHLKDLGIRGYPQEEDACPIANYVRYETGYLCGVEDRIYVYERDNIADAPIEYEISQAVQDFIKNFDTGNYPYLEIEQEDTW